MGVYGFETWNLSKERQLAINQDLIGHLRLTWPADFVAKIIGVSQPAGQYALGLAVLSLHNARGHVSYLFGQIAKSQGWPYFPVAFLLKTQLPLIILICLVPFLSERKPTSLQGGMLLLSVLIYALVSMSSRINIGVRHLLPIYPLLIIWASQIVYCPTQRRYPLKVSKAIVITGLACWYIFGMLSIQPHYMAYFNELAGGPKNGYRYLSDSNVDMGQDIKGLGNYLDVAGIRDVTVLCWAGSANLWACKSVTYYIPYATLWDPRILSSSMSELPTGFFAVGKLPRWFTGVSLEGDPQALSRWRQMEQRLQNIAPVSTIGYSIDLYYLSPTLSNPPA
jgi:hypothetical protein